MALSLETGEGLADADAFVSLAEVRAFAVSRGKEVSADDPTLEAQIRSANDYLVSIEEQFQGYRRNEVQALPFPRNGLNVFGRTVADGIIPKTLKDAVCQLVIETQETDALPAADARVVVEETVGPLTTKYAEGGTSTNNPIFPKVNAYLKPLFKNGGSPLTVERA